VANQIRGLLLAYGVAIAPGLQRLRRELPAGLATEDERLPPLGRITKRGKVYLRTLLSHGARAGLQLTPKRTDAKSVWVEAVRQRRGDTSAAVALAATHARIVWALWARRQE
jgi:transposase